MGRAVSQAIDIAAPADVAWRVLTDFPAYGLWNPFLTAVRGTAVRGALLTVRAAPPGRPPVVFRATLLAVEPPRRLVWRGRVGPTGLFGGDHAFVIEERGPTACTLIQSERFAGLLAPLVLRAVEPSAREGFRRMNHALKARAEASGRREDPP